jgi:hypothetical protein
MTEYDLEHRLRDPKVRRQFIERALDVVSSGHVDRDPAGRRRMLDAFDVMLRWPVMINAGAHVATVRRLWEQSLALGGAPVRAKHQAARFAEHVAMLAQCGIPQEIEYPPEFFDAGDGPAADGTARRLSHSSSTSGAASSSAASVVPASPSSSPAAPAQAQSSMSMAAAGSTYHAGLYLAVLFFTADGRVLATESLDLPAVFMHPLYTGALDESSPDFEWLTTLGSPLPDRPTHATVDGRDPHPLRTKFAESVGKVRVGLGGVLCLFVFESGGVLVFFVLFCFFSSPLSFPPPTHTPHSSRRLLAAPILACSTTRPSTFRARAQRCCSRCAAPRPACVPGGTSGASWPR